MIPRLLLYPVMRECHWEGPLSNAEDLGETTGILISELGNYSALKHSLVARAAE